MKVLLVSSSSGSRGGGELYLSRLGEALKKNGVEVGLWASTHPRMDELCRRFEAAGEVLRAPYVNTYDRPLRSVPVPGYGRQNGPILRQWRVWKPDLIHVNKQNLEDGLDLLHLANASGSPSVCTIHLTQTPSLLGARFARLRESVARRALRKYRGTYICVSDRRREDLRLFCPGAESATICNGVELPAPLERSLRRSEMRAELGVTPEEILIVAVGRFVEQKRPLFFLEKALEIQDTCPHAKFLWLGSLPESRDSSERASSLRGPRALQREWTDRVLRAHREKSILLQPWREDVTPFLAAADWYFHTADYEGLPFSLLEAMAASIPVVATRGLAREVGFLDEGNAWFFEDNPAWSALFDSPHIRERAQAARQLIERRFSLARMAREYEALYRRRIEAAARAL